jgi:DNA-directed RNA polymerase III subunit RPC2
LSAQVTSSTLTQKTRTTITYKNGKFYLKQNSFSEDVPISVIFKAMGMESDQEIAHMVGTDPKYLEKLSLSLQEGSQLNVLTQMQAMEFLASKLRVSKSMVNSKKTKQEEVKDILDKIILSHIALSEGSFYMPYMQKTRYMALMLRRIIDAIYDPSKLDDKDYYGNKRLELAGQLISLLFEDLFKRF